MNIRYKFIKKIFFLCAFIFLLNANYVLALREKPKDADSFEREKEEIVLPNFLQEKKKETRIPTLISFTKGKEVSLPFTFTDSFGDRSAQKEVDLSSHFDRIQKVLVRGSLRLGFVHGSHLKVTAIGQKTLLESIKVFSSAQNPSVLIIEAVSPDLEGLPGAELPRVTVSSFDFDDSITLMTPVHETKYKTRIFISKLDTDNFLFQGSYGSSLFVKDKFNVKNVDLILFSREEKKEKKSTHITKENKKSNQKNVKNKENEKSKKTLVEKKRTEDDFSGLIKISHIKSKNLNLYVEGNSLVQLSGKTGTFDVLSTNNKFYFAPSISAQRLSADEVYVELTKQAEVKVKFEDKLYGFMRDKSSLSFIGDTDHVQVFAVKGSGARIRQIE